MAAVGGGCQRRLSTMVVAARRRTTRHALMSVGCAPRLARRSGGCAACHYHSAESVCALEAGGATRRFPCCGEIKHARRQSALCRTSAAVCLDARAAGTVLISTTNLVTLPAPPSCYCVCRLQPPPLCAACSAFAAAVALLVLCLSIVCVPVCLLLSVRVCLREPLHVCMSEIVYQGVSFALLLSAPRVASSRHRRCCLQFQSCRRLREEAARCVVRQNSFSNSFQVAAHQCPHQPSIRCNRRRRAFRKLTEL